MYRKIIFLLLFVYCSVSCFSQTIEYKLSKDSVLESLTDRPQNFEKGQELKCNKDTVEFYVTEEETKEYRLLLFPLICENYKNLIGYDTNLELADSIKIFENKYIDLIPEYYLDVLKKKNPALIYKHQPKWYSYKKNYKNFEGERFEEGFWPETLQISNLYLTVTEYNHYLIEKINKADDYFKVDLIKQNNIYTDNVPMPECFIQKSEEKEISLFLKVDGDYIDLWINSPKDDYYIGKYCVDINKSTLLEIKNLVKGNYCNLDNVYWPRHADGKSDFDNEIKSPFVKFATNIGTMTTDTAKGNLTTSVTQKVKETSSTNVTPNKSMTVRENLKLRSGEATSTQVLTVMSAGTKVKILELGKAETIDGISSNWVKVEVQKGAKDRDGNPIKAGTVGWCYGGYLE